MNEILESETPIYKIIIDKNNYWTGTYAKIGDIPNSVECTNLPELKEPLEALAYKYNAETKELVFDKDKYQMLKETEDKKVICTERTNEISKLKEQLNNTDYKIIKCYEYLLAGTNIPYDAQALHKERQELRDKINQLESSITGGLSND